MAEPFVFDPYDGWSEEQLKKRCRELLRTASKYQRIAMMLGSTSPRCLDLLPKGDADDIRRLIDGHSDEPTPRGET